MLTNQAAELGLEPVCSGRFLVLVCLHQARPIGAFKARVDTALGQESKVAAGEEF